MISQERLDSPVSNHRCHLLPNTMVRAGSEGEELGLGLIVNLN